MVHGLSAALRAPDRRSAATAIGLSLRSEHGGRLCSTLFFESMDGQPMDPFIVMARS
jgi:hypothetical protein